jgi:hypothetical protein
LRSETATLATEAPKDALGAADRPPGPNDDLDHEAATLDSVRMRASAPPPPPPAAAADDDDDDDEFLASRCCRAL